MKALPLRKGFFNDVNHSPSDGFLTFKKKGAANFGE
jgi:hypothetical protein